MRERPARSKAGRLVASRDSVDPCPTNLGLVHHLRCSPVPAARQPARLFLPIPFFSVVKGYKAVLSCLAAQHIKPCGICIDLDRLARRLDLEIEGLRNVSGQERSWRDDVVCLIDTIGVPPQRIN